MFSISNSDSRRWRKYWQGEGLSLLSAMFLRSEYSFMLVALSLRYLPGKESSAPSANGSSNSCLSSSTSLASEFDCQRKFPNPRDSLGCLVVFCGLLSTLIKDFNSSPDNLLLCHSPDSVHCSTDASVSSGLSETEESFSDDKGSCKLWCNRSFSLQADAVVLWATVPDGSLAIFAEDFHPEKETSMSFPRST